MDLYEELIAILDLLAKHDVDHALCGGLAVALHGYPRFTKDIDLLIPPGEAERVAEFLADAGFVFCAGRVPFDVGGPNEREIFRLSKIDADGDVLTLDFLIVNDALQEAWETRELFEWQGRQISVVSVSGLATMKRMAGRDQDLLDLKKLGYTDEE